MYFQFSLNFCFIFSLIAWRGLISASLDLLVCLSAVAFPLQPSPCLRERGVGTRMGWMRHLCGGPWGSPRTGRAGLPWTLGVPEPVHISNILSWCVHTFAGSYRDHVAHVGLKITVAIGWAPCDGREGLGLVKVVAERTWGSRGVVGSSVQNISPPTSTDDACVCPTPVNVSNLPS